MKCLVRLALLLLPNLALAGGITPELVDRLRQTHPSNLDEVVSGLGLDASTAHRGFSLPNPYLEPVKVEAWYRGLAEDRQVCAVRFDDDARVSYRLKTFDSAETALAAGYVITHHHACGACSTLQDLAVYISRPDLTGPGRRCSKKATLRAIRDCLIAETGFSPSCAEAWAYNGAHTKKACWRTCLREYGLVNLMLGRYTSDNRPDGRLNACLSCDETESGPGFKYGAGRTRRDSGLHSSIERESGEIEAVDHGLYF